ncbi:hypothetical protein GCM10025790_20510 [Nesterenkonia rhizosphaerae]|uniref:Uncharacterized protein n=1 Tax=Nesterenkonia rhizosphaerae TaxID=1348272 RepID=A0ABP9FZ62_9MICC
MNDLLDITDTRCRQSCCEDASGCQTGYECQHHKRDFDAARARAAQ